jgi:hypothetical protein
MTWTDVLLAVLIVIAFAAILRYRARSGDGSCCNNEGMDDDGYSINRHNAAEDRDSAADADSKSRQAP